MKLISLLCIILLSAALPAHAEDDDIPPPLPGAGPLTEGEVAYFLEESYGQYSNEYWEPDWEDHLYAAMEEAGSPDEAISIFAETIGTDRTSADVFARAIVELVKLQHDCFGWDETAPTYDCRFEPGSPAYDSTATALEKDIYGEVAFIAAKILDDKREWIGFLLEILEGHTAEEKIYARLFRKNHGTEWLIALTALATPDEETSAAVFRQFVHSSTSEHDGRALAILEELGARPDLNVAQQYYYTAAKLAILNGSGLHEMAVTTYDALPSESWAFIPEDTGADAHERHDLRGTMIEASVSLSALLLENGRGQDAARELTKAELLLSLMPEFETDSYAAEENLGYELQLAGMQELFSPSLSQADIYDYFLYGRLPDEPAFESDIDHIIGATPGWLFALSKLGAPARNLASDYLRTAGYDDMAAYLDKQKLYYRYDASDETDIIAEFDRFYFEGFEERTDYWRDLQDAAWEEAQDKTGGQTVMAGEAPAKVYTPWFEERDLTEPLQSAAGTAIHENRFDPVLPDDPVLPVEPYQVVRYGAEKGEQQIVYLSAAYDAPGEIPAYGYWFQQTDGGEWQPPLYLGFQQYFPYVILSQSRLPMLGDGSLFLEVERQEIDKESISFPPVGLSLKEEKDDIYLVFPLDALASDRDDDGMSDIVEMRVQMDPENPDTDGDGIPDGRDAMPLTAFDPDAATPEKELAYALLAEIIDYDRGALMVAPGPGGEEKGMENLIAGILGDPTETISDGGLFMTGRPELFAGVRLPFRLFVLNDEQVEAINAQGAPFYPVGITDMFSRPDGSEHYVMWSASWVWGEFIVRCTADGCETEVVSEWIT